MNKTGKFVIALIIFAAAFGVFDFSQSNAQQALAYMHLFDIYYNFGLGSWLGFYPPIDLGVLSWELNPATPFINITCFLILPSLIILILSQIGGVGIRKKWDRRIFFVLCAVLISVVWDVVFTFLVFQNWNVITRGNICLWLPTGFGYNGISFTWQFGFLFILARLVVVFICFTLLSPKARPKVISVEGVI